MFTALLPRVAFLGSTLEKLNSEIEGCIQVIEIIQEVKAEHQDLPDETLKQLDSLLFALYEVLGASRNCWKRIDDAISG